MGTELNQHLRGRQAYWDGEEEDRERNGRHFGPWLTRGRILAFLLSRAALFMANTGHWVGHRLLVNGTQSSPERVISSLGLSTETLR